MTEIIINVVNNWCNEKYRFQISCIIVFIWWWDSNSQYPMIRCGVVRNTFVEIDAIGYENSVICFWNSNVLRGVLCEFIRKCYVFEPNKYKLNKLTHFFMIFNHSLRACVISNLILNCHARCNDALNVDKIKNNFLMRFWLVNVAKVFFYGSLFLFCDFQLTAVTFKFFIDANAAENCTAGFKKNKYGGLNVAFM